MDQAGQQYTLIAVLRTLNLFLVQVMENIRSLLQAANSDLDRIVKVTIYMRDMGNFPKIVEARKKWFTPPYPADTIVEVSALALPELLLEIDVIAVAGV